jgi:5-formyltetrahydrofolate cyclo-ligase
VDLAARKARLRAEMSQRCRAIPADRARSAGEAVARCIEALPEYRAARSVGLYAALPDEVPTRPLFEGIRRSGRTALLPRIAGVRLEFVPVERWEDLVPGRYGVLAPPSARAAASTIDLVLVPGRAFDPEGRRLGRGGGHYDRTFAAEMGGRPVLIGIAYEVQMVDDVPHAAHDRRVSAVVTERGVHRREADG